MSRYRDIALGVLSLLAVAALAVSLTDPNGNHRGPTGPAKTTVGKHRAATKKKEKKKPAVKPTLDKVKVDEIMRMAKLQGLLEQKSYPITVGNADAYTLRWAVEILPWFAYEGIADPVIPPTGVFYYFAPYGPKNLIDSYVFHILGLSACQVIGNTPDPYVGLPTPVAGPVFVNGRYINPVSPWYQDVSWLATLVHELGHTQGICEGRSAYIESSTQLATLEVLSAMANSNNPLVLPALVDMWKEIVSGALQYEAIRDGLEAEYERVMARADKHDPGEAARRDASRRFWASQPDDAQLNLKDILYKYEWVVYQKALAGGHGGRLMSCSSNCGGLTLTTVFTPSGQDLVMDDFAYFLGHAPDLVLGWPITRLWYYGNV